MDFRGESVCTHFKAFHLFFIFILTMTALDDKMDKGGWIKKGVENTLIEKSLKKEGNNKHVISPKWCSSPKQISDKNVSYFDM